MAALRHLPRNRRRRCLGQPRRQGRVSAAAAARTDGVEDDPEGWTYWKIDHGIRWTGMPSWKATLSDQQMWTLALFLKHMDKLSPAARASLAGGEERSRFTRAVLAHHSIRAILAVRTAGLLSAAELLIRFRADSMDVRARPRRCRCWPRSRRSAIIAAFGPEGA